MTDELRARLEKANQIKKLVKCCKALCIIGEMSDAYTFLWALEDEDKITEAETEQIMEQVQKELAYVPYEEIKMIRNQF